MLVPDVSEKGRPTFLLFLACGAGMYGGAFERKAVMFRRAVVPLLAIATVIEIWVTPEITRIGFSRKDGRRGQRVHARLVRQL
ncbi:hypothetical protein SAMN02745219_01866 [Desulfofundulus thermosubterraneus DSM 16057]|uniref:Uncharacterized protein n=1 Tax=Desulfofundulus thermosubterraneus DSM 16057 TaxID=1121432 RepID=A0A1M6GZQ9_9FIRM|nr:hypothetical protein SAMN02745219_01866 [Desulfofundulus thermosubterraneus DSM 16057]